MDTNNLILVTDSAYWEMRDYILEDWIQMYAADLDKDTTFELYKLEDNLSAIKASHHLNNEQFYSLARHFDTHIDAEYQPKIKAYTTIVDIDGLVGKKLMFYVGEKERYVNFLNVRMVTESNQNYEIGCFESGEVWTVDSEITYCHPNVNLTLPTEIIPVPQPKEKPVKVKRKKSEYDKGDTGNKTVTFLVCLLVVLLGLLLYLVMH